MAKSFASILTVTTQRREPCCQMQQTLRRTCHIQNLISRTSGDPSWSFSRVRHISLWRWSSWRHMAAFTRTWRIPFLTQVASVLFCTACGARAAHISRIRASSNFFRTPSASIASPISFPSGWGAGGIAARLHSNKCTACLQIRFIKNPCIISGSQWAVPWINVCIRAAGLHRLRLGHCILGELARHWSRGCQRGQRVDRL